MERFFAAAVFGDPLLQGVLFIHVIAASSALRGLTKTAQLWSGASRPRFSAMKNPKGGLRPVFHLDLALTRMPSARATKLQSQYITCTETLITVITLIRFLHETPTDITL